MTDKSPASLTSSLLARKGDAASSADESLPTADGDSPTVDDPLTPADDRFAAPGDPFGPLKDPFQSGTALDPEDSVDGTPVAPETDRFLDTGSEPVASAVSSRRRSWNEELEKTERKRSRGRRAPLLILAVLLVVALAGTAWFAANMFLGGGKEQTVAASKSLIPVGVKGTAPVVTPPPAIPPRTATVEVSRPPAPPDPVTNDPQDAPRIVASASNPDTPEPPPAAVSPPPPAPEVPAVPPASGAVPPTASQVAPTSSQVEPVAPPTPPALTPAVAKPPPAREATPVPAPPRKTTAKATGSYAVQLASLQDRAAATREMRRLAVRFTEILGGTPLRIQSAKVRNRTVYRIKSASVLSSDRAKSLCRSMKSKRQACFVVAN